MTAAPRPLGAPPLPLHAGPARPGRLPRATASPAGWTWSSSATRSSRPGRCWPGPPWRRPCAATTACPSCSTTGPTWRSRWGRTASTWGRTTRRSSLARRILGPDAIVGLSTHGPADLEGAAEQDVTYISAGPVEATPTKPGRAGTGLGYVTRASARSSVPVFVTGGVTPERIPALTSAGVRHFVVVRYSDPRQRCPECGPGSSSGDRSSVE